MLHRVRTSGPWRVISLGGILAIALVTALAGYWISTSDQRQRTVAVERFVSPLIAPAVPPAASVFGKSRIHVLVLGRDYDYDAKDMEYSSQSRSDVIMAFTIDFPTGKVTELSVPRDTAVTMSDGSRQKINGALSEGGIAGARKAVSSFLGVPFDRYVMLRIDSTKQLIDAIGGVDVRVKQRIDYDDSWGHLHVHVGPGLHHFDGNAAVSYARFRHDSCGDPCRIARQQDVLHAIATKLGSDKVNDLFHARALIAVVRNNVTTDFSARELLSLAWALRDVSPSAIATAQVPYSGDVTLADGGDALVPDDTAKRALVRRLMLAPFAPPAPPATPASLADLKEGSLQP
jgi:LCP family protein required for cell wall assembly